MSEINDTPTGGPDFDDTFDGTAADDAAFDESGLDDAAFADGPLDLADDEVDEEYVDYGEDGPLDLRAVDMPLTAADAAALGLTGVLSLMRPDDVAPGPGRLAYRLAYGALSGAALWLTSRAEETTDLDAHAARNLDTGIALGGGVLSSALFDSRISANWWADDLLEKMGIRHPRVAAAGLAVAATAGAIMLERWLDARTASAGYDGIDFEDEETEVELTPSQRTVLDLLVVGESANARSLRDQLAQARFFVMGDHNFYRVEVPQVGQRILPHTHLHPTQGRFTDADGLPALVSLRIEDGYLAAVEVGPDWLNITDELDEWTPYESAEAWPKPAEVTLVKDER